MWCAKKDYIYKSASANCHSGGKAFAFKSQAQAEHQRLKKKTTTASTSGSKSVWWCANKYRSWGVSKFSHCGPAKVFTSRYQAQAEHQRLKGIGTASTSTSYVWCATEYGVSKRRKASCSEIRGQAFSTKVQAKAGHQRLKNQTTVVSKPTDWCIRYPDSFVCKGAAHIAQTAQTAIPQPSAIDKTAEVEFWKSVKDSNDPDMHREYLRQFPSGVYAGLAKLKIKKLGGDTQVVNASIPNLDYGNYHALVIGNNRYRDFTDLNTPINDARTVASILKSKYNFEVNTLENATESEIFKAIINLRSTVGRNDNVLIYYGGHGDLDNVTDEGFWIPSDAKEDDPSTYLAVDRIRKQIKAMPAKHVMVVADSCFAGSLTRSTLTRALKVKPRSPEYHSELQRISNKKSRTALTSGGLEPVMDSGSDGHSVFAGAFISALEDNDGVLDAHMLFIQVRNNVRNNSSQNPEYSPIYETGHDGGDFLFVRQ